VGRLVRRLWQRHRWSLPLSIGSALSFAHLGSEMRDGELDALDAAMHRRIASWRGGVDGPMLALTAVGGLGIMTATTATGLGILVWSGRRREARYLLTTAGGGLALNLILKALFRRARPAPVQAYLLASPTSMSFPSGHTMGTTGVVGGLLVVLRVVGAPRGVRRAATVLGVLVVGGVGLSRVYLGAHYPSDVMGGLFAAAAWVSAVTGWTYPRVLPGESGGDEAPDEAPAITA
jgi:undecaprenyl-diphosphatase